MRPHDDEDADLETCYAYPGDAPFWLRANMVASIDGAAAQGGSSLGLSGKADRRLLQVLRGLADVLVVGAGTVRREGYSAVPAKTRWQETRRAAGQAPAPATAVVSRSLDLDPGSALFTKARVDARTIVLTTESAPAGQRRALEKVADVVVAGETTVDIPYGLDELARRGRTRQLCEGGPRLLADVAASGRLDELCLTVSPMLAGGESARITDGPGLPDAARMSLSHVLEEDGSLFLRYVRDG